MFVFVQAATSRVQAFQSLQETNTKLTNRAQHQHWGTGSKAHKYTSSLAGHRGTAHTSRAQLTHKQGTAQEQGTKDTQHRHRQLTHTHSRHTQHTQTQQTRKTGQCAVAFACAAMPGVWIGGLPWWASQQEVLNWCWTFGSNPEGIQLIRRRDDTLISCIAHYGSLAGQQAALRALGHSFYGFRVSVRPQRLPAAKAVPGGLPAPALAPAAAKQAATVASTAPAAVAAATVASTAPASAAAGTVASTAAAAAAATVASPPTPPWRVKADKEEVKQDPEQAKLAGAAKEETAKEEAAKEEDQLTECSIESEDEVTEASTDLSPAGDRMFLGFLQSFFSRKTKSQSFF